MGKNEFYFSNIPLGTYEVIVDGNLYGNISINENKVNEVTVIYK